MLELLEEFDEYTISLIPREQNSIVDSLASSACLFKIPIYPNKEYQIQVKHRPSIPDNVKNWQVFEDNHQIKRFLENEEEFINTQIEQNPPITVETISSNNKEGYLNVFAGKDIIQLKNNYIPKGLVPLEDLFEKNDVAKNPKVTPNSEEVEDFNIGTDAESKMIKLSKALDYENRHKYITLMKEVSNVFAWSYGDLKEYDTYIIQHTIPIKEDEKLFRQKLRRINPLLLPLIEK